MMAYWSNWNDRERWMVGASAALVLCYFFYLLIYSPLTQHLKTKKEQLHEKQATLVWMQEVSRSSVINKNLKKVNSSQLLSLIAVQFHKPPFQKYPHQLQQTGQGEIQITFKEVPYRPILQWLWTLHRHFAITLKQVVLERTERTGIVKLTLVITLPETTRQH